MWAAVSGDRSRWIVAAAGAVTITAALLMLFRIPSAPVGFTPPAGSALTAPVELANPNAADLLLKEEVELRDLRPLFLPTDRNAALPEPRLEPGRTFLDDENLKLSLAEAELQVSRNLPPVVTLNGRRLEKAAPADALAADAGHSDLLGFGRAPVVITPFESRGAALEVIASSDGTRVFSVELPIDARPPGEKPWAPLEFLAVVDAAGLSSPLVVTQGSRVEEVDAYFRNFLARNFRIGERLAPGFYRIIVAP